MSILKNLKRFHYTAYMSSNTATPAGILLPLFLCYMFLVAGCTGSNSGTNSGSNTAHLPGADNVQLWITKDYGSTKLVVANVNSKDNTSVMDILRTKAKVRTTYGGGFVESINGLGAGYATSGDGRKVKLDWFYYVNGVVAPVGAASYVPRNGDTVWWDFHQWDQSSFIPAVIGCYPNPFLNGFKKKTPTYVLAPPEWENRVRLLVSSLLEYGVEQVEFEDLAVKEITQIHVPRIVVSPWEDLQEIEFFKKLNEDSVRRGVFMQVKSGADRLAVFDVHGQEVRECSGDVGVIVATGSGMGDNAPLWLVTGLSESGTQKALEFIINSPEGLKFRYGLVLDANGDTVSIPLNTP